MKFGIFSTVTKADERSTHQLFKENLEQVGYAEGVRPEFANVSISATRAVARESKGREYAVSTVSARE